MSGARIFEDVDLDCFDGYKVGCRYFGDSRVEWRLQSDLEPCGLRALPGANIDDINSEEELHLKL